MREFLKSLELEKETIDVIMKEHGKILTEKKGEVQTLQDKIKEHEETITKLNSTIEDNNKSLESLQTLTNENKDLKAEIQMNGSNVKKEFSKFVRSEVMANVNEQTDFTTALESYKKDNPQYFGEVVVKKVQSSPSLNAGGNQPQTTNSIMNDIIRSARNND
jgi:septal ring factor EnvC (AmiA/AmiB activator)